jgi:hypothetical protein
MARPASRRLTGADGASPSDDIPMSMDYESASVCPGPQLRQPDALMGRRPWPLFLNRGVTAIPRRWVGRGTERAQPKLSQVCGFDAQLPRRLPSSLPTPATAWPSRRSQRLTTRPDREPGLTGLPIHRDEPDAFRMATDPGTDAYRDRSPCIGTQPPGSAERGRQSPHECWVRLVFGRRRRPLQIAKPRRRAFRSATAATTPGAEASNASSFQGRGRVVT